MNPISRILCPIDFSESSQHALAQAAAVARASTAGVTLLHVFVNRPAMDLPPAMLEDEDRQRLVEKLRALSETVAPGLRPDVRIEEAPAAAPRAWECRHRRANTVPACAVRGGPVAELVGRVGTGT